MGEELKEELKRLGADVRPESELPAEVQEMITRYAPGMPGSGRVGVELKRLADEQVYVYEDERLRLTVPVPSLEVFEAVVRELERLGPDLTDLHEYVTILARAFWLLHQRPGRRGLFARLRREKYAVPEVDEAAALELLRKRIPRADVVVTSLAPALFGLLERVMFKKKEEAGRQGTAA
ncbi:MAG: hypothetical protein V3T41_05300 [bacterium]